MRDFDSYSRDTPVIANLRPVGKYLMEDFYDAGGLKALLWQIRDHLKLDCVTANGQTMGENIKDSKVYDADVIRSVDNPVAASGGTYVLQGNLAPNGCVIKPAAAEERLLKHRGAAVVFEDYADLKQRINDENLEIDADSIIVLKSAGPLGAPGFPEWGMLPIPNKLLRQGIRDMVRISDARMSGTSYGMCVLHVSPESHIGGPLAFVKTGDMIELDVHARRIHLDVSDEELASRRTKWQPPAPPYTRGYGQLFANHVTQAHEGCDFDFLQKRDKTDDPKIY
jgi:dihydroxy-acid dehydratase